MTARFVSLVATWLLLGCGADDSELQRIQREYQMDAELTPYIAEFRAEMAQRGLPAGDAPKLLLWRNLDADEAIGLCILPYRFVYIHPLLRGDEYPSWRRALVYHELAHCMYEAPHEWGEVGHILSPYLDAETMEAWTEADWEYELDRLAAWIRAQGGAGADLLGTGDEVCHGSF